MPGDSKHGQTSPVEEHGDGPNKKPWVDEPYKLLTTPYFTRGVTDKPSYAANNMAQVHNVILRGLNAIYHQAPCLSPSTHPESDIRDFLFFCSTWARYLTVHHDVEELEFFPAIESLTNEPGLMDGDREQHAAMLGGLEKFTKYVNETEPARYDGQTLWKLVEGFGSTLETHLHDEIESLLDVGRRFDPDGSKVRAVWGQVSKVYRAKIDKTTDLPLIIVCTDKTYEGGIQQWPPLPLIIHYLVKYHHARGPHAGSWRFGGADLFGKPKELKLLT